MIVPCKNVGNRNCPKNPISGGIFILPGRVNLILFQRVVSCVQKKQTALHFFNVVHLLYSLIHNYGLNKFPVELFLNADANVWMNRWLSRLHSHSETMLLYGGYQ